MLEGVETTTRWAFMIRMRGRAATFSFMLTCWFGVLGILDNAAVGGSAYVLQEVFRDDFAEDELNLTRWNAADVKSEVNNELQYYRPDNVYLFNGTLHLVGRQEDYGGCAYTSGRVDTRGKFNFSYGESEWRARVPSGRGLWPALWLVHPECAAGIPCFGYWPPSVSLEARGQEPEVISVTAFYVPTNGPEIRKSAQLVDMKQDMSRDFHVYKMIWTTEALLWFVDGAMVFSMVGSEKVPTVALQVVMNLAVGGNFAGEPDNSTRFPAELLIDYVVVRQGDIDISSWVNITTGNQDVIPGPPVVVILLGSLVGVLVATLTGVFGGWMYRRRRRRLRENSLSLTASTSVDSSRSAYLVYLDESGLEVANTAIQHYVHLLEIPLVNVEVGGILGRGEHGIVRKGVATGLRGQPLPTQVAIKTMRNKTDPEQIRQIIQEMKIMTQAGRHLNIINLLGAVFKGETYLLLEYSENGSLLKYLRSHQGPLFNNYTDADGLIKAHDETEASHLQQASSSETEAVSQGEGPDGKVLSTHDLMSFAFQVSRGMVYLNSRSIIHRDLAARNILVCQSGIVKIADFGMARQVSEYLLLNQHVALPVRWMAPESIRQRTFSQKSDVWSFGVLMWELFSLGETPFSSSTLNVGNITEFLASLLEGSRMQRPPACPSAIYDIMLQCWRLQPVERPTFSQLEQELTGLVGRDSAENYLVLDKPYQQFNVEHQNLLNEIVGDARYTSIDTAECRL